MNDILKQIAIFKRTHTGGVLVDITPALREVLELLEPSKFDKRYDTRTNQARNKLAKILEVEE